MAFFSKTSMAKRWRYTDTHPGQQEVYDSVISFSGDIALIVATYAFATDADTDCKRQLLAQTQPIREALDDEKHPNCSRFAIFRSVAEDGWAILAVQIGFTTNRPPEWAHEYRKQVDDTAVHWHDSDRVYRVTSRKLGVHYKLQKQDYTLQQWQSVPVTFQKLLTLLASVGLGEDYLLRE